MTMRRRIEVLEAGSEQDLPPSIRRWLGWPVSDQDIESEEPGGAIDTNAFSKELKSWLGID